MPNNWFKRIWKSTCCSWKTACCKCKVGCSYWKSTCCKRSYICFKRSQSDAGSEGSSSIPERASWSNPIEFILSCMGYAIGLGNVWRFPYLCYRNGGGVFLIVYFFMVLVMGLPIFLLELVVGQYSGLGPNEAFSRLAPIFSGLGYCTLVVITLVTVYYMVIIAWTIFYFFASFSSELGWGKCDNDFNTERCYSAIKDLECMNDKTRMCVATYFNKSCECVQKICEDFGYKFGDSTHCKIKMTNETVHISTILQRTLSSEEYYNEYVLGINDATWENFGGIRWQLVLCLLLAWIIAYFCVIKGVKTSGKAVYFTALFPYVILTALLIRGATLDGAIDGILLYITPDWSSIFSADVWGNAASQTFYSFGIACGSLITLSSYSSFTNNCHKDALIVTAANCFTSVFAGFSIFAVLGFLAQQMQVSVSTVAQDGPGLAFVAYPEAVLRMPLPQVWAVAFFLMLFTLGLGSQFAGIEAINTAILDKWPNLRNHQAKVTLCTCVVCFLLGLPMCCSGGIYIFTLMEWNTASWAILLIGFAEVAAVAWAYGCNNIIKNMVEMTINLSKVAQWYWWICWTILTPIALVGVFIFTMSTFTSATFGEYKFPPWADALGWLMGLSTLIPMPIFAVFKLWGGKYTIKELFKPTSKWGPAVETVDKFNSMESLTRNSLKSIPIDAANHV